MARFFLGKVLCVQAADGYAEGLITETEAYGGIEDAACHAHLGRRTNRTRIMYAPGGVAYVYLCYGLHRMFNIVTGPIDSPEAVLVRAVEIVAGREIVRRRRRGVTEKDWARGPGRVCAALGIGLHHHGHDLAAGQAIWIEDRGLRVPRREVATGPRVGIDYAGDWIHVPWRFVWKQRGAFSVGLCSNQTDQPSRGTRAPGAGKGLVSSKAALTAAPAPRSR